MWSLPDLPCVLKGKKSRTVLVYEQDQRQYNATAILSWKRLLLRFMYEQLNICA